MLSANARTRKCNRIVKLRIHFRREKTAKMTNRQLKKYTLKKHNECLKDPRLNKMSVKKLKTNLNRFNKALYERFPDE